MKKIFLALTAVIAISISAYAQRPTTGNNTFTFGVNGLQTIGFNTGASQTGTLLFRHYMSESNALRLSANVGLNVVSSSQDDAQNGRTVSINTNGFNGGLAVGFQHSYGSLEKLEPYAGIDLGIGFGTTSTTNRTEITDETKTVGRKNGDFNQTVTTTNTPFGLNLIPMVGFNYYIVPGLAIGGEFGYGLLTSFGGEQKSVVTGRVNGTDNAEVETIMNPNTNRFGLGTGGTTNVTVTVMF